MLSLQPQQFVTWDQPIEMLYACHSKVQRFCRQLQILPDYLAQHGCNQAVKNDVQQILNYFNQSAPLHHADEEQDFFPALARNLPQVQMEIDLLSHQHESLHANWDKLALQLQELLAEKREKIDPQLIQDFIAGYAQHIEIEERLFELGKTQFSAQELQAMGERMFARRKCESHI